MDGRTDGLHIQRVLTLTARLNRIFTSEYVTVITVRACIVETSGRTSAMHQVSRCVSENVLLVLHSVCPVCRGTELDCFVQ